MFRKSLKQLKLPLSSLCPPPTSLCMTLGILDTQAILSLFRDILHVTPYSAGSGSPFCAYALLQEELLFLQHDPFQPSIDNVVLFHLLFIYHIKNLPLNHFDYLFITSLNHGLHEGRDCIFLWSQQILSKYLSNDK